MTVAAIIVAAGRGLRAGGAVPKQWRHLAGRRVADHTVSQFVSHGGIDVVVLVVHPDDQDHWEDFKSWPNLRLVMGGEQRSDSVKNGLQAVGNNKISKVLIHDVARPCTPPDVIDSVIRALDTHKAAAPGMTVTDALWRASDGHVSGVEDRAGLFAAQTPQGFDFDTILAAHFAHPGHAADDVEVARASGIPVAIVPGAADNLKLTHPEDFARAERILANNKETQMDIRCGNGFDVHRFGPGDHVVLCGVTIPHARGLQGHSDADVGMHAVTDAIYGALADGDIGQHFPPSDPQWKGAPSDIFLRHACARARERGFAISNVDCTLVCEFPKIGPHAVAMREKMADIMDLAADRVSVKATTSEKLGFTGRGEGIAAIATVTLVAS